MLKNKPLILWKKWKELSRRAASFQGRVLLVFIYFTLLAPFGVFFWLTGNKQKSTSTWESKDAGDSSNLDSLKHQ